MIKCKHNWMYSKEVKNAPKFINHIRRDCFDCDKSEFVRNLEPNECSREGSWMISFYVPGREYIG